ncbi:unnamed protein product [Paramecium octaurelia]|uniref:Uncharacterized protein n=1 Tax=Paramecium octaurelia TaxID=43137 RepID=A0A8S1V4W2_PAROT|nr:unnamed protein product [Paramecium octaurelia]CAD8171784.1 unnamed protein product [Paramecium octaurelia]
MLQRQTIICWKQIEQNEWKRSNYYTEHNGYIQQERIKNYYMKGDINQNELTHMYTLETHSNSIWAISLNEIETILISCRNEKQTMVWEKHQGMFYIKQVFTPVLDCAGCHIKFLNKINSSGIQLNNPRKYLGCALFPKVYLKKINVLIVSIKSIYLMKEINDCGTKWSIGTITDNGNNFFIYLVFWDNLKVGYTSYELI